MVPAIKPRAAGAISEVAGSPCLKPVARVRATPEGWAGRPRRHLRHADSRVRDSAWAGWISVGSGRGARVARTGLGFAPGGLLG